MGAAFEVYNLLGCGLAEEIYQASLEVELRLREISFSPKVPLRCFYKEHDLGKFYMPDLVVFGCLVIELKAVTQLATEHEAQILNYLHVSRRPVGYLVNFGYRGGLQWKRMIISKYAL